ncbi:MAG: Uma2 family endonuclease [Prosthecobacter sp.]|uniref:Uma2 family endonuclease n=1 Tax=Prosthecobacter sp. TaxID=1965333 RepID=UPI0038FFA5EA
MPITPISQFKPKTARLNATSQASADQFVAKLKPGVVADFIGGKVCPQPQPTPQQAVLATFLHDLMRGFLEKVNLPGVLYREPFLLKLGARDAFMPDVCYFDKAHEVRLGLTQTSMAPTFVAEVASGEEHHLESAAKFAAYEQHGAQELWLLDAAKAQPRFFRRAGKRLEEFASHGDKIASATIPGFWVRREWLDAAKMPKADVCLKEIMRCVRNPAK